MEEQEVLITMPGLVALTGHMAYQDGCLSSMRFLGLLLQEAEARGFTGEKALRRLFRRAKLDEHERKQVDLLIYELVDTLTDEGVAELCVKYGESRRRGR
jgi:hypothetical protein